MSVPEILAPAGSMESLFAAIRSGADAVYLGAKDFSARKGAENFSFEELKEAVNYCHLHSAKAYLALNTLMRDSELQKALDLAVDARNIGIDAIIIQDLGLVKLLRDNYPEITLHASTQMSIHTPEGAKYLYEMGFKRVVLARELSYIEIKEIAESCPVELEVFVHGALCMSVSGQCYFSAMLGGRSGNRGMCAQPCRLPFSFAESEYALSLKDNSLIDHLQSLSELGIASLKIEGRMKRPEYVATATKAVKEKLTSKEVSEDTQRKLRAVFSRTGFTDGYFLGKIGKDMFGNRRKEDVVSADNALLSEIRQSFKDEYRHIPITMSFSAHEGETSRLTVSDGNFTVTTEGEILSEKARNVPLSKEKCKSQLLKCGGTPYLAKDTDIEISISEGITIPISEINNLRRKALSLLTEKRTALSREKLVKISLPEILPHSPTPIQKRARIKDLSQLDGTVDGPVFLPIFTKDEDFKTLLELHIPVVAELPRGMFGAEKRLRKRLREIKSLGVTSGLTHNIGGINLLRSEGFTLHGGFSLNLSNTYALLWAQQEGFESVELSFELTQKEINALGGDIPRGIVSGGYLPLMLCRCCPGKLRDGGCASCKKTGVLQDRLSKDFIFSCEGNCVEILNSVELFLDDRIKNFSTIDFHIHRFSVENSVEKVENRGSFSSKHQNSTEFTRGLYFRGVK